MSSPRPAHSRPSPRRYALRRAGALAVVVLVGYAVVRVAAAVLSSGESVADANGPLVAEPAGSTASTDPAGAGDAGSVSVDPSVVPAPDTSPDTAPDTAPVASDSVEPAGPASPANPAKVLIVGDSDAGTFGPYLETLLDGTQIIETELDYKVSSGLARPDFFDWPAALGEKLPAADADIVVVTFGGNDAQGLAVADGTFIIGDPVANEAEWSEEYQRRVGEVLDLLLQDDRTVIWVGIPNDDSADVTARMAIQDRAAKAAVAERPEVVFIDTWKRFSGRDGGWAEFVIDPRDGQGKDVRASDGFHLNATGAEILALDIAQAVRDALRADGADI
jgi:uncharacterized protein